MRRWRPLSSSRSRNVISSPQATRVAFVSPFRIPSSYGGNTGTGIKLQWKSTHSALHHRHPLLFSVLYCQRRQKRVNKILLCTPSSSLVSALPSHHRLLSRLSRYRLISRTSFPIEAETKRIVHFSRPDTPGAFARPLLLFFNYLVRFKFVIVASTKNKSGEEMKRWEEDNGEGKGRQSRLYLTILYCFYYYILL